MKFMSQSKKWLLAGSALFFAFACQSNSNDSADGRKSDCCNPCKPSKIKKCTPTKDPQNYRPGRCSGRPCGDNAAADVIQTEENLSEEAISVVEEAAPAEVVEAALAEEIAAEEVVAGPVVIVEEVVVEEPAVAVVEAAKEEAAPEEIALSAPVVEDQGPVAVLETQ